MPKLAAFPKAYLDVLCGADPAGTGEPLDGVTDLNSWIALAARLDIDGLELYSGIRELQDESRWAEIRERVAETGMAVPMLCCSPDFTHPDPAFREREIEREREWIRMAAGLGASFCRVLSGQRRPDVSREDGVDFAARAIEACLPAAAEHGVTLVLENHYKDAFWKFPEFAQRADVFCELVARIDHPNFGVNYDPSNTLLAGEDPIELLERVADRVVTMHASDRFLKYGTLEDLAREEGVEGYAARLSHGEIGKGMNDYGRIFSILSDAGFDGWISIEDGMDGFDQLARSVDFVRRKMRSHFGDRT